MRKKNIIKEQIKKHKKNKSFQKQIIWNEYKKDSDYGGFNLSHSLEYDIPHFV